MNLPTFAQFRRLAEQRAREIATRTPGTIAAEMIRSTERQAHEAAATRATSEEERGIHQLAALTGCSPDELRAAKRRIVEQHNNNHVARLLSSAL